MVRGCEIPAREMAQQAPGPACSLANLIEQAVASALALHDA